MKRLANIVLIFALCLAVAGCTFPGSTETGDNGAAPGQDAEEPAANDSDTTTTDEDDPYASGTHHAKMHIVGYGEVEIEIYADSAPQTASAFCNLVEEGYYNCTYIDTIMKGLYVGVAGRSDTFTDVESVPGEYEEAGYTDNHLSLTGGVIAMGRDDDGTVSDPSELIVFVSDASYLDGQYAGFAKVTKGIKVMQAISDAVADTASSKKSGKSASSDSGTASNSSGSSDTSATTSDGSIKVKKNGTVKKKTRPLVRKIEMID